jgi:subtilisin family serine protease
MSTIGATEGGRPSPRRRIGVVAGLLAAAIEGGPPEPRTPQGAPPTARTLRIATVDQARTALGVEPFVLRGGRDGAGVVLAVIDTGFDPRHPTLRGRIAWMLDHRAVARGAHPPLEARFHGAVWGGDELARALVEESARGARDPAIPIDRTGHGTFVASVAAGRADALISGVFEGIAPGAELVLARVGSDEGISDEAIVEAMDFVLERAGERPVIVVLAAGSTDGARDGSSAVERAIDQRFSSDSKRLLVVAAGNEGGAPSRVRAEVARGRASAIPFTLALAPGESTSVTVVHEGPLDLALRGPDAIRTRWVSLGEHPGARVGDTLVGIDRTAPPPPADTLAHALREGIPARVATITLARDGSLPNTDRTPRAWALLVRGDATLDAFGPASRVRFSSGGSDEATLLTPATAARAVTVTALATRDDWPGPEGPVVRPVARGADGIARFSSRGPDRVHRARPELAAPGAWILGARSGQCDPRASGALCSQPMNSSDDPALLAAAGTSVAAPVAAGALARLWSTVPSLSPDALVSRATAGSPGWSPRLGWGPIALASAAEPGSARATRCTLTATVPAVTHGHPVIFSLRALDEGRATEPAPAPTVQSSPPVAVAIETLPGGRALLRARAPLDRTLTQLTLRAAVDDARCEATVTLLAPDPLPPDPGAGGCAIGRPTGRGGLPWLALLLAAVSARSARRGSAPR